MTSRGWRQVAEAAHSARMPGRSWIDPVHPAPPMSTMSPAASEPWAEEKAAQKAARRQARRQARRLARRQARRQARR